MINSDLNHLLLPRFGWMLFDDVNKRLSILIEECLHLQQVVHYYGGFDISSSSDAENAEEERRLMEHFKQTHPDYINHSQSTRSMMALYDHLGGLVAGLKSHREQVRFRFEAFLNLRTQGNSDPSDGQKEAWFWFVALRGHLIHDVIEMYMTHIEHAHEKLIQILETRPSALPQAILLRRWNSSLHGRFLSEYSRHIDWETNFHINQLKKKEFIDNDLRYERHATSFIHSWAHEPTSMASSFRVNDDNKDYKFGSIRSAFFYLEMPQLYPLLYHECAHLQFDWDKSIDNDEAMFFSSRKKAANSLEESAQRLNLDRVGFWEEFTEEIWADMIAINLARVPYLTALTMQIMGHGSGQFFYSNCNIPLQDWAKQPVYDLEQPQKDNYFWQARLKLAIAWLRLAHEDSSKNDTNYQWIKAIEDGIKYYQEGGKIAFSRQRTRLQNEQWWQYRDDLNNWVYDTIHRWQLKSKENHPETACFLSSKYTISDKLMKESIIKIVQNFEKKFFCPNSCEYGANDYSSNSTEEMRRIEYLPFHIKWYLSKRIIMELHAHHDQPSLPNCKKKETFTYAYANFIRNDGSASFRIALEWITARNELFLTFADYLDIGKDTSLDHSLDKLKSVTNSQQIDNILKKALELPTDELNKLKQDLRYQRPLNSNEINNTTSLAIEIYKLINQIMEDLVTAQFREVHSTETSIGTFTLAAIAKNQSQSSYYDLTLSIHKYFEKLLEQLNHPERQVPNAAMPLDHSTLDHSNSFSYGESVNRDLPNAPSKTGLYFVSGHYDFVHYQDGITPGENTAHPSTNLALLTNSRTVMDLIPISNLNSKPRMACGKISLIKFRYRWEMYILAKQLQSANYRARLRLSSAWEDGVLTTWHDHLEDFWGPGLLDDLSMDTLTSSLLFKFVKKHGENQSFELQNCKGDVTMSNEEINPYEDHITSISLWDLLKNLTGAGEDKIFSSSQKTIGRSDYIVEWKATTPEGLCKFMLKLPKTFWHNVAHMNTVLRLSEERDAKRCYFVTEISTNSFPILRKTH